MFCFSFIPDGHTGNIWSPWFSLYFLVFFENVASLLLCFGYCIKKSDLNLIVFPSWVHCFQLEVQRSSLSFKLDCFTSIGFRIYQSGFYTCCTLCTGLICSFPFAPLVTFCMFSFDVFLFTHSFSLVECNVVVVVVFMPVYILFSTSYCMWNKVELIWGSRWWGLLLKIYIFWLHFAAGFCL